MAPPIGQVVLREVNGTLKEDAVLQALIGDESAVLVWGLGATVIENGLAKIDIGKTTRYQKTDVWFVKQTLVLSDEAFDTLVEITNNPPKPTDSLRRLMK